MSGAILPQLHNNFTDQDFFLFLLELFNPPKVYLIASHLRLEREEDSNSPLVLEFSYCPAFVRTRVQNYLHMRMRMEIENEPARAAMRRRGAGANS